MFVTRFYKAWQKLCLETAHLRKVFKSGGIGENKTEIKGFNLLFQIIFTESNKITDRNIIFGDNL